MIALHSQCLSRSLVVLRITTREELPVPSSVMYDCFQLNSKLNWLGNHAYCKKTQQLSLLLQLNYNKRLPPDMTKFTPFSSIFAHFYISIWQFAAFPYIQAVRKAAKHQNKNLSSEPALLIPTVSTIAFHSTNLVLFSRHHTPANSVAPFSAYEPTHNPQFLQSL